MPSLAPLPIRHIAVVMPAHNEQDQIAQCLLATIQAKAALNSYLEDNHLAQIQVSIIVVLDSCTDNTQSIVEKFANDYPEVQYLKCDYRCVGQVRALGVRHAINQSAEWIACTDADSQVSEEWLVAQVRHLQAEWLNKQSCDMICGVVCVDSWEHLSKNTKAKYLAHYQDRMNHRHIHGANLCFLVESYTKVGGFSELACHEDVDLVKKFEAHHLAIIWSNQLRVMTSSRLQARASEGFASFLLNLEQENLAKN